MNPRVAKHGLLAAGIVSVALLLGGCTSPPGSYADAPRNPKGYAVDPVYGTRLPGQYNGF